MRDQKNSVPARDPAKRDESDERCDRYGSVGQRNGEDRADER